MPSVDRATTVRGELHASARAIRAVTHLASGLLLMLSYLSMWFAEESSTLPSRLWVWTTPTDPKRFGSSLQILR
jgi:hypothetical protein